MVDRDHYEGLRRYVPLILPRKQSQILTFMLAALQVTYPLITQQLINQLTTAHAYHNDPTNNPPPKSIGYSLSLAFALFAMIQASSLFSYQALQRGSVIGFMMRAALIDLIGSKSMWDHHRFLVVAVLTSR